jgi:hypothetical protein
MQGDQLRRRLTAEGEHFFPIRIERDKHGKDQKRPAVYWRLYQTEKPSDEETEAWNSGRMRDGRPLSVAGWALVCGATRLVCIDIEKYEPELFREIIARYPANCRVASPNGGVHIWLRIRETNLNGAFPRTKKLTYRVRTGQPDLALAEVRGAGGYALLFGPGRAPADDWAPHEVSLSQYEALCLEMAALGDRPLPQDRAAGGGFGDLSTSITLEQARLDLDTFVQAARMRGLEFDSEYEPRYDDDSLYRARCPVHQGESDNSLQFGVVADDNPKFVVNCFGAHCSHQDIFDAVGFTFPALGRAAENEFWRSRSVLAHIDTFARARLVSPWAVFGVTLARVVAATDPDLVLPPPPSEGTLNTFVALVGRSGAGKSAAMDVSRDAVIIEKEAREHPIGSGEGIATVYVHREGPGKELVPHARTALFEADEIGTVGALKARSGSTLMDALRKMWSGRLLGNTNRNKDTDLPVAKHTYRACFIAGVQPGAADILLNEAETGLGTPQRFLWFRASDTTLSAQRPAEPVPVSWAPPRTAQQEDTDLFLQNELDGLGGIQRIELCSGAQTAVDEAALARAHGMEIDGHLLFCKLKVGAGLMLLDGRTDELNEEDWALAGIVMAHSTSVRDELSAEMRATEARRNVARGRAMGVQQAAQVEAFVEKRTEDIAVKLDKHITMDWISTKDLRGKLRSTDRDVFDDAASIRVQAGTWETKQEQHTNGTQATYYRLAT